MTRLFLLGVAAVGVGATQAQTTGLAETKANFEPQQEPTGTLSTVSVPSADVPATSQASQSNPTSPR